MSQVVTLEPNIPTPTAEELRHAYTVGARSRALEEHIVKLVSRGEVKFVFHPWILLVRQCSVTITTAFSNFMFFKQNW